MLSCPIAGTKDFFLRVKVARSNSGMRLGNWKLADGANSWFSWPSLGLWVHVEDMFDQYSVLRHALLSLRLITDGSGKAVRMAEYTAPIPIAGVLGDLDLGNGLLCKESAITTRTDDGFTVLAKQKWPQVQLWHTTGVKLAVSEEGMSGHAGMPALKHSSASRSATARS